MIYPLWIFVVYRVWNGLSSFFCKFFLGLELTETIEVGTPRCSHGVCIKVMNQPPINDTYLMSDDADVSVLIFNKVSDVHSVSSAIYCGTQRWLVSPKK